MLELENAQSRIAQLYRPFFAAISVFLILVFYSLFVLFFWYSVFVVGGYYHRLYRSALLDAALLVCNLWTSYNVFFNYLMATATNPGTSYLNESP